MAEPFGVVSGVLGLLGQIVTLADEVAKRFQLVSTNRAYLARLREEHTQICRLLGNVHTLLRHPHARPSPAAADNFRCILDHVHSLLRRADDATAVPDRISSAPTSSHGEGSSSCSRFAKMRRVGEHVKPFVRARKTEAELTELENVLGEARVSLVGLTSDTEICRQFGEIREVGMGQREEDVFRPTFTLPVLPPRVVLQWESAAGTMEAELKKTLLESMESKREGEWGVVVGATGLGGVGKTTALIGLGREKSVQQWFRDGVYWVSVGKDASEKELVKVLADMVEGCGGLKSCVSIGKSRNLSEAVGRTSRYFHGKRALFMVDDIWMVEGDAMGYLGTMRGLLSGCADSRMVMSTRSKEIAHEGGRRVEFGPRENQSATAKEILFCSAGVRDEDMKAVEEECEEEMREILEFCGGVPLTLGVAGRAIHLMEDGGGCVQSAVRVYAEELRKGITVVSSGRLGSYPNFRTSVWISLRKVGNVIRQDYASVLGDGVAVSELYKRFAVVGKQMYVPIDMVRRLWGMKSDRDVENVLGRLWDLNLVSRRIGAYNERVVGLHDLLIEFCEGEAGEKVTQYHAELLDVYCDSTTQRVCSGDSSGSEMLGESEVSPLNEWVRPWFDEEFSSDKYLMVNLVRHLGGGEKVRELACLLTDARWTMRRLTTGGLPGWNEDFTTLLAALPRADKDADLSLAGTKEGFMLVRDVVRDSWGFILKNRNEFAYQVHARLQGMDTAWPVLRFLGSAARIAPRPWLRAVTRCWPAPGSTLLTLLLDGFVSYVSMAGRAAVVVVNVTAFSQKAMVVDLDSGETIHTLVEAETSIGCAASADGGVAVTAVGKVIRVWDVQSGQEQCAPLYRSCDDIKCIAINADGARVVYVPADGNLRVWDTDTRNERRAKTAAGLYGEQFIAVRADGRVAVVAFRRKTLTWWDCENEVALHTTSPSDWCIECIAMTPGGEVVVSGCSDGIVRVWKAEKLTVAPCCLHGHTSKVTCVDVSADAHVIVSSSVDKTIRVWTGGCLTSRVLLEEPGTIWALCLDPTGRHILWGCWDRTMRVQAVGLRTSSAPQERVLKWSVICLAASADRRRLVTGCSGGGVAVWDVTQRRMIWKREDKDSDDISCVRVSAGGEHVASITWDGDVRVRCGKTGREIWKSKSEVWKPAREIRESEEEIRESEEEIWGLEDEWLESERKMEEWQMEHDAIGEVRMTEAGWMVGARRGRLRVWRTKDGCEAGKGIYERDEEGDAEEMWVYAEMVTVRSSCGWFRWKVEEEDGEIVPVDALVDEGVSVERWAMGNAVTMKMEGGRYRCRAGRAHGNLMAVEAGVDARTAEKTENARGELELYVDRNKVMEGGRTLATLPNYIEDSGYPHVTRRTLWYDRRQQVIVAFFHDGSVVWLDIIE